MKEVFFALILAGLYERNFKRFPELSLKQWKILVETARRQTVTGLLYQGVTHLPEDYPFPQEILLQLVSDAGTIERQGERVRKVADELTGRFEAEGLHPIVMKGPEAARFYAKPLLRECGDLDLYFPPNEISRALELARTVEKAPDGSFHFEQDGVNIDLHKDYFNLHTRHLPPVPSPEATLLMLSGHILKHCMGPGIGLRQFCDMAMAHRALAVEPDRLREVYRKAGLERWNRLLYAFLHEWLGVEPMYDGELSSKPLMDIILHGGNFGHYSASRSVALHKGKLRRKADTALRYLKRLPFSLKYAPREVVPAIGELLAGNLKH